MLEVQKETKGGVDPKVYVQLADGSRYAQPGKVNFVDVTVNPGTDTVLVRAVFANPDRILVDGQLVTVVVEEEAAQSALVIPQRAIQSDQTGAFVLVVDSANKVEVQRVEVDQGPGDLLTGKRDSWPATRSSSTACRRSTRGKSSRRRKSRAESEPCCPTSSSHGRASRS
jgi:multidrug efflux pump subunit AcrA (membrane-fusion protein)